MRVITLHQTDAVAMVETLVEAAHLAKRSMGTFNREKIQYCGRHQCRPRIHQQQQPGVINAIRNHTEKVLLRIAVWIRKDPIEDPHRQRRDVAGWHYYF